MSEHPDVADVDRTRIQIPGTANLRDPGGYRAAGGRTVRRGRYLRSEALLAVEGSEAGALYDPAQEAAYRALGLRTVVDLRTELEVTTDPSAWALATGAEVLAMPIPEGSIGSSYDLFGRLLDGTVASYDDAELGAYYVRMLEGRADVIGAVARLLADQERVPLLVHCSAGKDRTGITTAVVLETLGVPRDVVVADYALTERLRPGRVHSYADQLARIGVTTDAARVIFESPAGAMRIALAHLDVTHGGAAGYLIDAAGLTADEVAALRNNLLEDA